MRKTFSNVCRCEPRTSQTLTPQQTDDNEASTLCVSIHLILYSSYWRGLSALSILCGVGNAKAFGSRIGKETDTYAFFVYMLTLNMTFKAKSGVFERREIFYRV